MLLMLLLLACASTALETYKKIGDSDPPTEESSRESTARTLEFHTLPVAAADAAAAAAHPLLQLLLLMLLLLLLLLACQFGHHFVTMMMPKWGEHVFTIVPKLRQNN